MSLFYGYGYGNTTPSFENTNLKVSKELSYERTTTPVELPVSLALVKTHLRITTDDDDAYLTEIIEAVRRFFEDQTNRILITTGFSVYHDYIYNVYELRRAKLQSLDSFQYLVDDTFTDFDSSIYDVTSEVNYSRIIILERQNFPTDKDDKFQSILITFTAGYGTTEADIPYDLKFGLLNHIAYIYENRGDCSCDCFNAASLPPNTQFFYNKYRIDSGIYGAPYRGA